MNAVSLALSYLQDPAFRQRVYEYEFEHNYRTSMLTPREMWGWAYGSARNFIQSRKGSAYHVREVCERF